MKGIDNVDDRKRKCKVGVMNELQRYQSAKVIKRQAIKGNDNERI